MIATPAPSPEHEARMHEALGDPAKVSITITGRNGFDVTYNYPLYDWEKGTVTLTYAPKHQVFDVFSPGDQAFREPLPRQRTFGVIMETEIR